jgi:hypothetical protein
MSGRIALLAVAILTFCGISAAADSELRRKRRVLHIDSVDDGNNLPSSSLNDSDLWGRHLAVGSPDGGDKKKGGKMMMMGMMAMDVKKKKGMNKGGMGGGKNKGGMEGMMKFGMKEMKTKKKKAYVDEFWGGVLNDFSMSMSMPDPTPSPTRKGAVIPVPTPAPTATSSNFDPTPPPTSPPVATALPTSAPAFLTEAPVVVTDSPSASPITPTDTPSLSPFTVCSTKSRSDAFFSILEEVTSPILLNDPSTPQGFAYDFLVSVDPAAVDPCTYPTVEQRYAAVTLYSSTSGRDWTNPTGWLTAANECNWIGVRCNENDLITGLFLGK